MVKRTTIKSSKAATRGFHKIGVLKIFAILTGKYLCWSLFLINFFNPALCLLLCKLTLDIVFIQDRISRPLFFLHRIKAPQKAYKISESFSTHALIYLEILSVASSVIHPVSKILQYTQKEVIHNQYMEWNNQVMGLRKQCSKLQVSYLNYAYRFISITIVDVLSQDLQLIITDWLINNFSHKAVHTSFLLETCF